MRNPEKNSFMCFVGRLGWQMFPVFKQKIAELLVVAYLRALAVIVLPITDRQTGIPGVVDLSPKTEIRQQVSRYTDTEQQAYEKHLQTLVNRVIQTHQDTLSLPAVLLFVVDKSNLIDFVSAAESIKARYHLASIVVVTEIAARDLNDPVVRVGMSDLLQLVDEDIVDLIIPLDTASNFAASYGAEAQRQFASQTLLSLLIAWKHNHNNVTLMELVRILRGYGALAEIRSASVPVIVGNPPARFSLVPFVKGYAGTGSDEDIERGGKVCIDKVMQDTDEDTSMFQSSGVSGVPLVIVVDIPVRLDDPRHEPIARELSLYASTRYGINLCLVVRGNGCAYPHHVGSRFLVQASSLTPLPAASIFHAPVEQNVKVTQLRPVPTPDPVATTSLVPSLPKNVAKAPTARQKKTVPSRRVVVRKNTRQAK